MIISIIVSEVNFQRKIYIRNQFGRIMLIHYHQVMGINTMKVLIKMQGNIIK